MTNAKHTLAMTHYDNCAAEAWDDIQEAMQDMRHLYNAAPDLLNALELAKTTLQRMKEYYGAGSIQGTIDVVAAAIKSAKGE